MFTVVLYI